MQQKCFPKVGSFLQLYWAPILTISVAIIATWVAVFYAGQPLLERHGFRQTQTALTSYWMIREGWQLAYQTPVAGYPWAIPMEFPLFQSLAALITWLGGFQLDPVGRLLSFCFVLACAWPAFEIVRRLNLPREVAWVFCTLLWSSPIYLFWGRTFMIETAALFFTLAALPYTFDLRGPDPHWRSALFFALFGTLGMLQKITTAAPVFMVMAFMLLFLNVKNAGLRIPAWRQISCVALAFVPMIIIALLWYSYTDSIKIQNIPGFYLTSSTLSKWNFGTIAQRLDPGVLKLIFWDRVLTNNAAGIIGLFLLSGAVVIGKRPVNMIIAVSLFLFVLPVLIFINLHYVHDYYQSSSVVFLIFALAVAVVLWLPKLTGRYAIVPLVVILLTISNFYHFRADYANNLRMPIDVLQTTTLAVSDIIRRYTPPNSAIVVFGNDWNSDIAYYSQRKSFTVPNWFKGYDKVWFEPGSFIGNKYLGAIVFCVSGNKPNLNDIMARSDIKLDPCLFKINECYIWLPGIKSVFLPNTHRTLIPMDFYEKIFDSLPTGYSAPISTNCEGSIDVVNGIFPAPKEIKTSNFLSVDGWLAVSGKDGIVPDNIFVTLKNQQGITKFLKTRRVPRNDVKEYFKQPAMLDAGYTTTVNIAGLRGDYVLGLAKGYKGKLEQCAQFNIPVKYVQWINNAK